jgi:hypothetical protein
MIGIISMTYYIHDVKSGIEILGKSNDIGKSSDMLKNFLIIKQ